MQHLMKLLERDQYIHLHRLKDEDVVVCTENSTSGAANNYYSLLIICIHILVDKKK